MREPGGGHGRLQDGAPPAAAPEAQPAPPQPGEPARAADGADLAWEESERPSGGEAGGEGGGEGSDRRRRWSLAEKLAVVAEASGPTTNMSAVARRHGITPTQLYRWKKDFRGATPASDAAAAGLGALAVREAAPDPSDPPAPGEDGLIEIHLLNGRRIKAPPSIDAETLAKIIKAVDT